MGAWGGLCIFDYTRYTRVVVPAFQQGERTPTIQNLLQQRKRPHQRSCSFRGLAQLAAACDPLMTTCSLDRNFMVCDGVLSDRPNNQPCAERWGYEEAADLFESMLTRHTISHYTILGLAFSAVRQLFPPELTLDQRTQELLELLEQRCHYWAAGTGGYGEGPRGWLDPAEAVGLLHGLGGYAPHTLASTDEDLPQIQPLYEYCGESAADYARHMGRIRQFIALLRRARDLGQGVLWGRDLQLFYHTDGLFSAAEHRPIELT